MANGKAPWDKGNGTFIGKGDPLTAENLGNSISWVAVQPDADPAAVAKLKADGYQIVVWEQPSSQAGMDAVKKFGAAGYICGAEGPGQYQNGMDNSAQLGNIPKAMYSNYPTIPSPDGKWPPGWDAMPEVYTNKDPSWNASNKIQQLEAAGATDIIPIFGLYDATSEKNAAGLGGPATYPVGSYIDDSKRAGAKYFATYAADTMQAQDYDALRKYGNNPVTGAATNPGAGVSNPPVGGSPPSAQIKPSNKQAIGGGASSATDKTDVAPLPGAIYYKRLKNGAVLSYMSNGNVVETKTDGGNYVQSSWDPKGKAPEGATATGLIVIDGKPLIPETQTFAGTMYTKTLKNGTVISYLKNGHIIEQSRDGNAYDTKKRWDPAAGAPPGADKVIPGHDGPPSGIKGEHVEPGTQGAPAAYTGGAPVVNDKNKTFGFTDQQTGKKVTITTTSTGAVIEQVAGKTPYTIKKAAPPPGDKSYGGPPPPAPTDKTFAQAVQQSSDGDKTPAWRSNSGWTGANNEASDKKAGLNPDDVLEERPGSEGKTVYRMKDGSYQVYDPATGKTTFGGNWDADTYKSLASGGSGNPPSQPNIYPSGNPPPKSPAQAVAPSPQTDASTGGPLGPKPPTDKNLATAVDKDSQQTGAPTYRTDPRWGKADPGVTGEMVNQSANADFKDNKGNAFNPNSVLEMRPGDNGSMVYRMDDGSYVSQDKYGVYHNAGSWDNTSYQAAAAGSSAPPPPPPPTPTAYPPEQATGGGTPPPGIAPVVNPSPNGYADNNPPGAPPPAGAAVPPPPSTSYTPDPVIADPCFPAGTQVLTPDGTKPIESLKVGDSVSSWDFNAKQMIEAKITKTFKHPPEDTLVLITQGGQVTTTAEHRFWTGSDWTKASDLTPGKSSLFTSDGELQKLLAIVLANPQVAYNFHVQDPAHNYFAQNYLVHNRKTD